MVNLTACLWPEVLRKDSIHPCHSPACGPGAPQRRQEAGVGSTIEVPFPMGWLIHGEFQDPKMEEHRPCIWQVPLI